METPEVEVISNIMVTDFDGEANVCIFTKTLTIEEVEKKLSKMKEEYTDIFLVEDDQLQYYSYEPCWIERKAS